MGPSLQHMRPFGPTWPERADPEPRYHHDSTSPTHAISPRSRRQWPPAHPNPTTQNLPAPGSLVEDGQHRTRTHQRSNTSKNEAQRHQEFRRRRRDDATQRYRAANRKIAAHRRPEPKKIETPTTVRRSPRPSRQTPTKPKPGHQTVQPNPRPQQQPQPPTLAPPRPQHPGATTGTPNAFQHAVRGHAATPNTHGPHAAPAPSTARHSHQAAQPPTSALQKPANNPRQRPKKRQTPRRNTDARRKHATRTGRTAADTLWTAVPAHPTTRPLGTRTPRQRVRGTHRAPESPPLGLPLASTASPLPSALSQQPRWGSAKSLNSHGGSLRNLSTATVGYPVLSQQQIRGTLQSLNNNFLSCIFLHFVS